MNFSWRRLFRWQEKRYRCKYSESATKNYFLLKILNRGIVAVIQSVLSSRCFFMRLHCGSVFVLGSTTRKLKQSWCVYLPVEFRTSLVCTCACTGGIHRIVQSVYCRTVQHYQVPMLYVLLPKLAWLTNVWTERFLKRSLMSNFPFESTIRGSSLIWLLRGCQVARLVVRDSVC